MCTLPFVFNIGFSWNKKRNLFSSSVLLLLLLLLLVSRSTKLPVPSLATRIHVRRTRLIITESDYMDFVLKPKFDPRHRLLRCQFFLTNATTLAIGHRFMGTRWSFFSFYQFYFIFFVCSAVACIRRGVKREWACSGHRCAFFFSYWSSGAGAASVLLAAAPSSASWSSSSWSSSSWSSASSSTSAWSSGVAASASRCGRNEITRIWRTGNAIPLLHD